MTLLTPEKPVVFFDGYCGLCNWFVDLTLKQDKNHVLLFAPLQGQTAQSLIGALELQNFESIILYDSGKIYRQSEAVLRVLKHLGGFWKIFAVLAFVPSSWRNALYFFIAKRRYRWFDKKATCRMPSSEERHLFLP